MVARARDSGVQVTYSRGGSRGFSVYSSLTAQLLSTLDECLHAPNKDSPPTTPRWYGQHRFVQRSCRRDTHASDAGFSAHHSGITSDAIQLRHPGGPATAKL